MSLHDRVHNIIWCSIIWDIKHATKKTYKMKVCKIVVLRSWFHGPVNSLDSLNA